MNLCVHQFLHPSGFDNKIRNCIEILNLNLINQTAPIVCKSFFIILGKPEYPYLR